MLYNTATVITIDKYYLLFFFKENNEQKQPIFE